MPNPSWSHWAWSIGSLLASNLGPARYLTMSGLLFRVFRQSENSQSLAVSALRTAKNSLLHFIECHHVKFLALPLMRNTRKAHWIVWSTEWTEAERNHINVGVAEPIDVTPVELHHPSCLDGADWIEQEPDICEVDMDDWYSALMLAPMIRLHTLAVACNTDSLDRSGAAMLHKNLAPFTTRWGHQLF
jgi:hypothetical protein